jgi:hypothetical protein
MAQLKDMTIGKLWQLAAMLGAPTRGDGKNQYTFNHDRNKKK